MTGRDEQPQRRKLLAQPQTTLGPNFFFARMRAAAQKHQGVRIESIGRIPQGRGYSFGFRNFRIEFDAAGQLDAVSRNTERRPSLDVTPFWYTHQIEEPKRW